MIAIGEAARRSGITIETIRYYERKGIVSRPARSLNGRRAYGPPEVASLTFIRRCRDLGFTLTDARSLLALSQGHQQGGHQQDCDSARHLATCHLDTVRQKIAELHQLEAALAQMTHNCTAGSALCPVLTDLRGVPATAK